MPDQDPVQWIVFNICKYRLPHSRSYGIFIDVYYSELLPPVLEQNCQCKIQLSHDVSTTLRVNFSVDSC